jgi:hypothetical protein
MLFSCCLGNECECSTISATTGIALQDLVYVYIYIFFFFSTGMFFMVSVGRIFDGLLSAGSFMIFLNACI